MRAGNQPGRRDIAIAVAYLFGFAVLFGLAVTGHR
jgi:hypothetical protein